MKRFFKWLWSFFFGGPLKDKNLIEIHPEEDTVFTCRHCDEKYTLTKEQIAEHAALRTRLRAEGYTNISAETITDDTYDAWAFCSPECHHASKVPTCPRCGDVVADRGKLCYLCTQAKYRKES